MKYGLIREYLRKRLADKRSNLPDTTEKQEPKRTEPNGPEPREAGQKIGAQKPITAPGMEFDDEGTLKKYTGQEEVVAIPEGVTRIGADAFIYNKTIKEVILPDSLIEIKMQAFMWSALEKIRIPSGVSKIGNGAFAYCSRLNSVILSDQLTRIEERVFENCIELKELTLPPNLKEVKGRAFKGCGILELRIPNGMTYIGKEAFSDMDALEKLIFPPSLISIQEDAFSNCKNLKEVCLPEGLLEIGYGAFRDCGNLEKVNIPESLLYLEPNAFSKTKLAESGELEGIYKKVNTTVALEKPKGYQECQHDAMRFYYRSSKVEYKDFGGRTEGKPKEYGLVFDRELTDSMSVPTFDSSDREWDSYRKMFLIPDRGRLRGRLISGGYRIAEILEYEDLRCADDRTKKLLKAVGILGRGI